MILEEKHSYHIQYKMFGTVSETSKMYDYDYAYKQYGYFKDDQHYDDVKLIKTTVIIESLEE